MPSYQPFPIADYAAGEYHAKEPWLAPETAWHTLNNGYVKNGRLRKRKGYELLGALPHVRTVMGIFENRMLDGSTELIVFTDRRMYRFEAGVFVERSGAVDIWTGADTDYFSVAHAADNALYIVNGVNVPKKWQGVSATFGNAGLTGLTDTINSARWVLWWKGRLWYFFTNEGASSVRFPQRARFSGINTPETWRNADFIDATTSDRMTGVRLLGDRVIVYFEDSVWTILETGDFRLPFVFRQIPSVYGAIGRMASFPADDIMVSLSSHGLVGTNGDRVEKIDPELPTLMARVAADKQAYVYGGHDLANRHGWLLFVEAGDPTNKPNDALIYDWEIGAFAFYQLPMHVLGVSRTTSTLVWDDLTDLWDNYSLAWDDFGSGADAPLLLGGDRVGNVWKLNNGASDNGAAFTLIARTQRLNPWKGIQSRLGWVNVYASGEGTLRLKFYRDNDTIPILVKDISLAATSPADQVMRRVTVNKTARFHTIEIEHDSASVFALDALELWMAPVAKGRSF